MAKARLDETEWRGGWTAEKRKRFIEVLGEVGNVRLAARATGHASASSAYKLRHEDPGFAAEWDQAVADAVARIESALVAQALEAVDAQKAELDPGKAAKPMDFEQLMKLLTYYRTAQTRPVRGGPKRRYATREETDAALNKALDALAVRTRARKKREAAARKALRLAQGGQQEGATKGGA